MSDFYKRYKEKAAQTARPRAISAERARQNVLSAESGYADQPKDFLWWEKNIPCQAACPAKTDIPAYLDAIARGRFEEAYRINLRDNVFPAVLGRVCTRPCEPACRHGHAYVPETTDGRRDPVAICFSKRSAADFMDRKKPIVLPHLFPPTGKKVVVVGAGAAGLAAARELALWGHRVTVYEKHNKPGGLMVQGIPHFRLPRDIVELEIEQIRLVGVDIICNTEVGGRGLPLAELVSEYDAVILAAGTLRPNESDVPGSTLEGVRHGLAFLQEVNETGRGAIGRHVIVIGGGFTAVDCARTAKRLGAESVRMCYRRSEREMYITPGEVEEMVHEGIAFETLVCPVEYRGRDGRVASVVFARTELGQPDASGRRSFKVTPHSEYEMPADMVLLGIGQTQDTSWIDASLAPSLVADGKLRSGAATTTALANVFVAGDFATGALSLIDAIAHGKQCARRVDRLLTGKERWRDKIWIEDAVETGRTREMDAVPRQPMPTLAPAKRALRAEVETGLAKESARVEAARCYLCHYKYEIDNDLCIYCDRCLKVKPVEKCIVKVESLIYDEQERITGYRESTSSRNYNMLFIDQSQCIRCGACKDVCPVECISLQKVNLKMVPA